MKMFVPTAGYLALKLMPAGSRLALALLGVAVTLNDGTAGDDEINNWYAALSLSSDPVWDLNQYYIDLENQHSFLIGFLGPLTSWTEEPEEQHYTDVVWMAQLLSTVQWSKAEPACGGDILGSVYNEMMAIGGKRVQVWDFPDIDTMVFEVLLQTGGRPGNMADLWCGSGTRVLGTIKAMRLVGRDDPERRSWHLNDPSAIAVAMAGLNMVGVGVTKKVTLSCDRKTAEFWGATWGHNPYVLKQLPPEVAYDVPSLEAPKR